ncbi:putative ATP synthase subunit 9, mitochondrial [Venustampulla echinocandica]|uniref:ATP synthase subunit 9, mitochondrial n=1 Tax=Venustampulla echinocandica TaxID=2656787 RepID=A0A370TRM4_9HELO|nr:putative ATP synthase subunit 9, mitochondrial [Venustampulla echinocandica]RDL38171.1 putative ATP synthase subunit 9, mitochondrial [Venustampulla echinocandica]
MAARMIAPKMASIMASTSSKVARPVVRSSVKVPSNGSQRAFSGVSSSLRAQTKATPFTALKRQQASQILSHATRNSAIFQAKRGFSSEIATAMVQVSQNIGMGSAAIGLGGAGIGIGLVFAALLMAVARNPSMRAQLFSYAILGFAFVEAIGLFDLMVAMMCKYV